MKNWLVFTLFTLVLSSCGSGFGISALRPNETLNPQNAYVFGYFYTSGNCDGKEFAGNFFGITILNNTLERDIEILFPYTTLTNEVIKSIVVIPVLPGEYNYYNIVFFADDGDIKEVKLKSKEFQVDAGKIYYIGSWTGLYHSTTYSGWVVDWEEWDMIGIKDNFESDVKYLKEQYIGLSEMEAVNAFLNFNNPGTMKSTKKYSKF
ncbi:MAG: hypothetical protein HPY53_16425 [Brevinematales bacterium]|nr:hypothetical protein [Brevinematales bacterium]